MGATGRSRRRAAPLARWPASRTRENHSERALVCSFASPSPARLPEAVAAACRIARRTSSSAVKSWNAACKVSSLAQISPPKATAQNSVKLTAPEPSKSTCTKMLSACLYSSLPSPNTCAKPRLRSAGRISPLPSGSRRSKTCRKVCALLWSKCLATCTANFDSAVEEASNFRMLSKTCRASACPSGSWARRALSQGCAKAASAVSRSSGSARISPRTKLPASGEILLQAAFVIGIFSDLMASSCLSRSPQKGGEPESNT
mmetsp:Transcript_33763/g.96849  ORF Transcript_33763/g.96849 Transcript_33763/m.96849 type:complete len:260 (-) Transcript_33763:890-1669(-)